jgi:CTP-dependent riboflavin kinase
MKKTIQISIIAVNSQIVFSCISEKGEIDENKRLLSCCTMLLYPELFINILKIATNESQGIEEFVHYYNFERYHESLQNVTPSEVYFGTANRKIKQRKMTKNRTLKARKKQDQNFNLN